MTLQTNRDLYLAIARLIKAQEESRRSLEEYLRTLWSLASNYQASLGLSLVEFYELLSNAFSAPVPPFQETWRECYGEDDDTLQGYLGWQATIRRQIVDLHEMGEQGILRDQFRYFGVAAPHGQYWYNFDPLTFLECATEGTFGGWRPGDDTGRNYVPGKVVVLNEAGEFQEREPNEIPDPIYSMGQLTWDNLRRFLDMGQMYE